MKRKPDNEVEKDQRPSKQLRSGAIAVGDAVNVEAMRDEEVPKQPATVEEKRVISTEKLARVNERLADYLKDFNNTRTNINRFVSPADKIMNEVSDPMLHYTPMRIIFEPIPGQVPNFAANGWEQKCHVQFEPDVSTYIVRAQRQCGGNMNRAYLTTLLPAWIVAAVNGKTASYTLDVLDMLGIQQNIGRMIMDYALPVKYHAEHSSGYWVGLEIHVGLIFKYSKDENTWYLEEAIYSENAKFMSRVMADRLSFSPARRHCILSCVLPFKRDVLQFLTPEFSAFLQRFV